MQCTRCEFENMPGAATCFRCGAVLDSGQIVVDIRPPRAPAWKAPFRALRRRAAGARLCRAAAERVDPRVTRTGFAGVVLVLSVLPGLAHLYQKRFGDVWWQCFAWLFLLLTGLFFYGASGGIFLIGLAGGLHAWIILNAMTSEAAPKPFRQTMVMLLSISIIVLSFYHVVGRTAGRDIAGGYATQAVPCEHVYPGDYLLGRRSAVRDGDLPRGCMVLVDTTDVTYIDGGYRSAGKGPRVVAQLIGRPGEYVQMRDGVFAVNGSTYHPTVFPVPLWLAGKAINVRLGKGQYFLAIAYRVRGRADRLSTQAILGICVRPLESIEARMFVRWLPVRRRGFLGGEQ